MFGLRKLRQDIKEAREETEKLRKEIRTLRARIRLLNRPVRGVHSTHEVQVNGKVEFSGQPQCESNGTAWSPINATLPC